jgi:predicted LPLAT superfamily acyltransferase
VRAALERYVATLEALCREAPYNWFNFYDFWADAETSPAADAAR